VGDPADGPGLARSDATPAAKKGTGMATTDAAKDARRDEPAEPDVTIALDPHRPGIQRARLVEYGVPVWALIGYMGREGIDDEAEVERTAHDYNLPIEAVRAAIAFYREHRCAIDTLLDTLSMATYPSYPTSLTS
jgi:uncharacterized protein (DUF433 family)